MATFTYAQSAPMPAVCRVGVLTIGNFDGVHLGHQALVMETARQARSLSGPAIAVTFDPPPVHLLRPEHIQAPLTTLADRAALLQEHGADHVVILQTSPALLHLSARQFFEGIIVERFRAKGLVEGFNFGFGRGREGTIPVLKELSEEFAIGSTVLAALEMRGSPVSSKRVRAELLAGAVDIARELLGRPYRIVGIVGMGKRRGATLGFPTANLEEATTLVPGNGVYAARAHHQGKVWPAAVNVGPNPTFGEEARKIEVHLLGFSGNLYDERLAVDFIAKIRDTRPFGGVQELIGQIQADIAEVKRLVDG